MPKTVEKQKGTGAKAPLPEPKAPQDPPPVAGPQVAPAESEAGLKPADGEFTGDQEFCQAGEFAVERAQGIGGGAQQDA